MRDVNHWVTKKLANLPDVAVFVLEDLSGIRCGQSAISPARLALITIMQFAEGLTDRQAADAVRSRIDWKYALGLDLGMRAGLG